MDRSDGLAARAEELLRLLAIAVNSVRLYPAISPFRDEALTRFSEASRAMTGHYGPVQYRVDRHRFIVADTIVGEGIGQVSALAETLHALQVGQLIIAPGLSSTEILRFVDVIGLEPSAVQASGGVRSALVDAGVENMAVVEVSLRASSEEGLLGLDLTAAPLEDMARELTAAARQWAAAAASGSAAEDLVSGALERLEPAARDLAMSRCAEALRLLDEDTRIRVLASALSGSPGADRMDGMLHVIAHMPAAALARLLRLSATRANEAPDALLNVLEFPPELAAELAALLRPAAQSESGRGVPPEADVAGIVAEVAAPTQADNARVGALVRATTARSAASRGLATTTAMARTRPTEDSIRSMVEALGPAAHACAFDELADSADLLRELAQDPRLATATHAARSILMSPTLLRACTRAIADGEHARSARDLIDGAGMAGAEALLDAYLEAEPARRGRLLPVVTSAIDSVSTVAGRILRSGEAASAVEVVNLFGSLNSRRVVSTLAIGLEHPARAVREATLLALTRCPGDAGWEIIRRALGHRDPATRQLAIRMAGRAGLTRFVPDILAVIAEKGADHDLKQEALRSLEALHSKQAIPALSRLANRLALGRKNRELRNLARQVVEALRRDDNAPQGGAQRDR